MAEHDAPDMAGIEDQGTSPEKIRLLFQEAKAEVSELGDVEAFKNGEWLLRLIQKSFKNYWERANINYFRKKYLAKSDDFIATKLIGIAARSAGLLGGITGLAVSADEVIGVAQTVFSAGIGALGLPANVALAFTAISGEAIVLTRIQLQLVANLGKLYNVPLDADDPEDILTILAFAIGGGLSEALSEATSKAGIKIGGRVAKSATRKYVSKQTLATLKKIGAKLGVKILQRTIVKYVVPIVSVAIGGGWNYTSTKSTGLIAKKHFLKRSRELGAA